MTLPCTYVVRQHLEAHLRLQGMLSTDEDVWRIVSGAAEAGLAELRFRFEKKHLAVALRLMERVGAWPTRKYAMLRRHRIDACVESVATIVVPAAVGGLLSLCLAWFFTPITIAKVTTLAWVLLVMFGLAACCSGVYVWCEYTQALDRASCNWRVKMPRVAHVQMSSAGAANVVLLSFLFPFSSGEAVVKSSASIVDDCQG